MRYRFMPISVSLRDRPSLVVGGGLVALRKVESLLEYDTPITVVASEAHEKLEYHAKHGRIALERREYRSPEASRYGLVVSATDDVELNARVYQDGQEGGALVNVVDDPPHCDFIFPAVLRRDCLTAAISTDGKAPFVAGHLRLVLENVFPSHWGKLMKLAASFRKRVRERWEGEPEKKNLCYTEFLEADWKTLLKESREEQIEEELARILKMPE
jgi:siroheme synthase-like protein